MATVVRMPEVLAGATEATIATWLVAPGQSVVIGTPLAEIETEKAVVEYASEVEGTVLQLLAAEGDGVAIGDPIIAVGAEGEAVQEDEPDAPVGGVAPAAPDSSTASAASSAVGGTSGVTASGERRFASPLVRRLARERGIDLSAIAGSGPHGRIVRRDLDALGETAADSAAAGASAPVQAPVPAPPPARNEIEEIPVTPMRCAIARRLTESKSTVPHFSLRADCRVDRLLELRREINETSPVRVSVGDFVLAAAASALRAVPDANATWGETVIRRHGSVDIAVAVAVEGGLVTPVVRDVDRLRLTEISRTVADLAERARAGRLTQHELEGGAFSISNLGMYGTQEFAAIINPPQAAILAVGAARQAPVVEDGALAVGSVMTVTLSADHRVMDGALAAQWLAAFVQRIENPISALA